MALTDSSPISKRMCTEDTPVNDLIKDMEVPNNSRDSIRDQTLIKFIPHVASDHFSLSNNPNSLTNVYNENRPTITFFIPAPTCTWHNINKGQGFITSQDSPDLTICQFRNLSHNSITELRCTMACAVSCKRPNIVLKNMTLCVLMN